MTTIEGVKADKLSIVKEKQRILNNLSFTIEEGKITGLIGPSGSGKTTLMQTIVGVQKIDAGLLTVLNHSAGAKQLRSEIGYVTQSPAIYGDLTVLQNLRYFSVLTRAPKGQLRQALKQVGLEPQQSRLVATLSGGQRARVSLAIALLGNPELLIMDEPTVGLDPVLREELWSLFASLAAAGKTLLISSHVMDEADRCDSLLLLREGELLWSDSRQKLLTATKQKDVQDAFMYMIQKGKE